LEAAKIFPAYINPEPNQAERLRPIPSCIRQFPFPICGAHFFAASFEPFAGADRPMRATNTASEERLIMSAPILLIHAGFGFGIGLGLAALVLIGG